MFNPVKLPEPIEFLDLEHGDAVTIAITAFQRGWSLIHPVTPTVRHVRLYMIQNDLTVPPPAGTPISIWIPALRLYGKRVDKVSPLGYWDVSSRRLAPQLFSLLTGGQQGGDQVAVWMAGGGDPGPIAVQNPPVTLTLTAHGYKPKKIYSVETGAVA